MSSHRGVLGVTLALWLLGGMGLAHAQSPPEATQTLPEDLQPLAVGGGGTTTLGLSGYVDRFFSSERRFSTSYTVQIDVTRFVSERLAARGGVSGSGSLGGDDADELPSGTGAPALHAFGGVAFYFTPRSVLSLYSGAEYWAQLNHRADGDAGSVVGTLGVEGAMSSRANVFVEAGYGVGLASGDDGTLSRFIGRIGVRLKL